MSNQTKSKKDKSVVGTGDIADVVLRIPYKDYTRVVKRILSYDEQRYKQQKKTKSPSDFKLTEFDIIGYIPQHYSRDVSYELYVS